jgi:hypothetical protein
MVDWSILTNQETLNFGLTVLGFGAAVLGLGAGMVCLLDGYKIPSARAIQTLVQAWKEMRGIGIGTAKIDVKPPPSQTKPD